MSLYRRTVDQHVGGRSGGRRKSVKEPFPDAFRRPADIPIVEGFSRPILGRGIDPTPARLQDVDDTADHASVVHSRLAARVARKMRENSLELLV